MPDIWIRDVPDDVDRTLRRRAAEAGLSLDAYLLRQLAEEARTPPANGARGRTGRSAPVEFSTEHLTGGDGVPPGS
ncbi:antitoxin [Streptomyces sp. NPDC026673]|uniref:FitA-like ribbon-helix-helix domain-containing protein n=1 Tax=Streptomyces sp. NPDC026673 TaxID=3155724 RepID=UPI0033EA9CD4